MVQTFYDIVKAQGGELRVETKNELEIEIIVEIP
jgi:hypothetical protein